MHSNSRRLSSLERLYPPKCHEYGATGYLSIPWGTTKAILAMKREKQYNLYGIKFKLTWPGTEKSEKLVFKQS